MTHPEPSGSSAAESSTTEIRGSSRSGADLVGQDDVRKAAILVLALEESVASALLQGLNDEELEVLTAEIARVGVVEHESLSLVLQEFHDLSRLHGVLKEGGPDQAIRLVKRSFPPERSRRLIRFLESHRPHLPLAFLSHAETDSLLALLEEEHPQTVAVVLAHMTPAKAAEVLERFDHGKRRLLIERISSLQGTHEEVIEQLGKGLREHLDSSELKTGPGECGGCQAAADILRVAGRRGRDLLSSMRDDSPGLVEEIYGRLFVFEDLARLDAATLQRLVEEVDRPSLVTALASAAPALREKVLGSLPSPAAEDLLEELGRTGGVRVADVGTARQEVVEKVLELEEAGNLRVDGRRQDERPFG
ncbi:MAG: hypothetical protein O7J95_02855 [Planctomycetota bacterium]|nr:hypothetical protein [Planctomycetota bacterium]